MNVSIFFRQKDTIVWNIKYQLLPEDFVFYKNFKEFRLEQLRNKRSKQVVKSAYIGLKRMLSRYLFGKV